MSVVPHKKAKLDALGLATLLAAHPVTRDTLNEVLDDYESCKAFIMYLKAAVELQDHGYDMENTYNRIKYADGEERKYMVGGMLEFMGEKNPYQRQRHLALSSTGCPGRNIMGCLERP